MGIDVLVSKLRVLGNTKNIIEVGRGKAIGYTYATYRNEKLTLYDTDIYITRNKKINKRHFDLLHKSYGISTFTGVEQVKEREIINVYQLNENFEIVSKKLGVKYFPDYVQLYGEYLLLIDENGLYDFAVIKEDKIIKSLNIFKETALHEYEYNGDLHVFLRDGNKGEYHLSISKDSRMVVDKCSTTNIRWNEQIYLGRFRYIKSGEEIEAIGEVVDNEIELYDMDFRKIDILSIEEIEYVIEDDLRSKHNWMINMVCNELGLMSVQEFMSIDSLSKIKAVNSTR